MSRNPVVAALLQVLLAAGAVMLIAKDVRLLRSRREAPYFRRLRIVRGAATVIATLMLSAWPLVAPFLLRNASGSDILKNAGLFGLVLGVSALAVVITTMAIAGGLRYGHTAPSTRSADDQRVGGA